MNLLAALTKHRFVAIVCILAGAAASIAAGLARKPVYSAKAEVNAGRIDIFSQAVPGFVQAAATLATTYSRIAASDTVLSQVAQRTHLSRDVVASRIHAVPVVTSSVIEITGEGPSAHVARELATTEVTVLTSYVARLASATDAGNADLSRFETITAYINRLQRQATRLKVALQTPTAIQNSRALGRLNVVITAERLQAQVAANQYETSQQNSTGSATITALAQATEATSDRTSAIERFLVAGVVGGVLVALLIGLLLERRRDGAIRGSDTLA